MRGTVGGCFGLMICIKWTGVIRSFFFILKPFIYTFVVEGLIY